MFSEGLYPLYVSALCLLLTSLSTAEPNTVSLNVREGLTNYLLHCFNHGSASDAQKRISWFYAKNEITATEIPASFDVTNVTLLVSWSDSKPHVSDTSAWTVDDYQVGGKYSLRIYNASFPRDDGFFYCVDQETRDILRRFHLIIQVKITQISISEASLVGGVETVNVTAGETTQLSCQVNRANPSPEFLWTKDHHLFTNATYPVSGDVNVGLISFVPTREMNGETVRCLANNKNGPDQIATIKLNVLYSPTVAVSWQSGINVLRCDAEGNPGQYEFYRWEHRVRGTLVDTLKGSDSQSTSVLHLPRSGYFLTGDYVCSVSNGISKRQNASYFVQPRTLPVFEARSRTILAPSGQRLDISVGFYSHPLYSGVIWEKAENKGTVKLDFHKEKPAYPSLDFKDTPAHLPGNITTLSFAAVDKYDAGIYTVIVTNAEGVSSYSITLKVHDTAVIQQDSVNTIPVKEDVDVQSQRHVNLDEGQSAAQGSDENGASPVPVTLAAVVSCVSIVVIILVVVGVCLVKHGKISLYVRGSRYAESSGSGIQSGSPGPESCPPFENTKEGHLSGGGSFEDRSVVSCNTESTAGSISTISEAQKITVTYPPNVAYPHGQGPNGQPLLPPGSLQSMV